MSEKTPHRLLRYFSYEHLPPHLQAASKPFHDAAHGWQEAKSNEDTLQVLQALSNTLGKWLREGTIEGTPIHDLEEMKVAAAKLSNIIEHFARWSTPPMRQILEAKDCAVRSLIAPK